MDPSYSLIIAEKPSVARDLARVVGARTAGKGFLSGGGFRVSWALGHLVRLPEPAEINPVWRVWNLSSLPMIPQNWPLQVTPKTRAQFLVLRHLMHRATDIICATDAGREGELIFRTILEASGCQKPVRRLWISSLTDEAIQQGLANLAPLAAYDGLAQAAWGRARADWIIGMNLSRLYALRTREKIFVGRVQTPTLAMIVERDLAVANFIPENYQEIQAELSPPERPDCRFIGSYLGSDSPYVTSAERITELTLPQLFARPAYRFKETEASGAEVLCRALGQGKAQVHRVKAQQSKTPPPLLYHLTELQKHANRLYGFTATQVLEIGQALYERHKLISYPRTDSNSLSVELLTTLPQLARRVRETYLNLIVPNTGEAAVPSRFLNAVRVTDHHAIIPTGKLPGHLNHAETRIYDLVVRRFLMMWQPDCLEATTTILTTVGGAMPGAPEAYAVFKSQGTQTIQEGWKKLEIQNQGTSSSVLLPSSLDFGAPLSLLDIKQLKKKTVAPPLLSDAGVLSAMEHAGGRLENRDLVSILRGRGIGTAATRAGMIQTLLDRAYIERSGKNIISTALGKRVIQTVDQWIKSPELTARWEGDLKRIEEGQLSLTQFMQELETFLRAFITKGDQCGMTETGVSHSPGQSPKSSTNDQLNRVILDALTQGPRATGRLYTQILASSLSATPLSRARYEKQITALCQTGRILVRERRFKKNDQDVIYREVRLNPEN